jgi:hypothetical protein
MLQRSLVIISKNDIHLIFAGKPKVYGCGIGVAFCRVRKLKTPLLTCAKKAA